jgi:hypothetical protein
VHRYAGDCEQLDCRFLCGGRAADTLDSETERRGLSAQIELISGRRADDAVERPAVEGEFRILVVDLGDDRRPQPNIVIGSSANLASWHLEAA